MSIPILKKRIVRCWVDVNSTASFADVIAGGLPRAYNNASWELQIAFGYGPESAGVLVDVSEFSSLRALIWKATSQYLDSDATLIDSGLTLAEWQARSSVRTTYERAAHAIFNFTADQFSFDLGSADELELKLTLHGDTSDEPGEADAWARSAFKVINAGLDALAVTRVAANLVPADTLYDGSGHYVLAGLTVGAMYRWVQGANDTSVTNGTETFTLSNGNFIAQATSVTLNGTPGEAVTAAVWYGSALTGADLIAYIATTTATARGTFAGSGSPEGVQAAVPGNFYYDTANDSPWVKKTGIGSTGWVQILN